jgi:hypothetical protein
MIKKYAAGTIEKQVEMIEKQGEMIKKQEAMILNLTYIK